MEHSFTKAAPEPLTLRRLLDTNQATPVIPGVLYFATTGECLTSAIPTAAAAPAAAAATPLFTKALQDFFLKENPAVPPEQQTAKAGAATAAVTIPTTSAAIGADAVFVAPRGVSPYLYRPFFADFGPLDIGCTVHFARRLRELLQVVSGRLSPREGGLVGEPHDAAGEVGREASSSRASTRRSASATPTPTTTTTTTTTTSTSATTTATSARANGRAAATALPVVICASLNAQERVNTACLVGAFCVLALGWTTHATWSRVFADSYPGFLTYRDASKGVSNYPLALQDVWVGLEHAARLGWVSVDAFDLQAYWVNREMDMTWVVPRRFLAMGSPNDGETQRSAEVFARRLRAMHVRLVVRLNDSLYDPGPLVRIGVQHVDLPYADGSVPNDATLLRFLQAVEEHFGESVRPASLRQWWTSPSAQTTGEAAKADALRRARLAKDPHPPEQQAQHGAKMAQQYAACSVLHSGKFRGMPDTRTAVPLTTATTSSSKNSSSRRGMASTSSAQPLAGDVGAVAVHCLAGLGRTGTMIAVYVMRHYGFTARGIIGWLRLCRPGSITGVQQQYLDTIERRLRPSPFMIAAQKLSDAVVLTLRQNSTTARRTVGGGGSPVSAAGAASASAVSHEGLLLAKDGGDSSASSFLSETPAPMNAYQTHGNVVADARPPTSTGGTPASVGAYGRAGPHASPTLPTPPPRLRSGSNSILSIGTDHTGPATALDAVSSMPVLGSDAAERPRSTTPALSAATAPAASPSSSYVPHPLHYHSHQQHQYGGVDADRAADVMTSSGTAGLAARAAPRAGDFKYASTYFVALERANGRLPPPPPHTATWGGSASATTASTAAAAHQNPQLQKNYGRGRQLGVGGAPTARAATAAAAMSGGDGLVRRSSRLPAFRPPATPSLQPMPKRFSVGSGAGSASGLLSRRESFGDQNGSGGGGEGAALVPGRRVSLTSAGALSSRGVAANFPSGEHSGSGYTMEPQRPHTATAALTSLPPAHHYHHHHHHQQQQQQQHLVVPSESKARLRPMPQKPMRVGQPGARRPSRRTSATQLGLLWKSAELDSFPTFQPESSGDDCDAVSGADGALGAAVAAATLCRRADDDRELRCPPQLVTPAPPHGTLPAALLPVWGRPVGSL